MMRTLFYIPREVGGWPMFGFGVLLGVWIAISAVILVWYTRRRGGFDAEVRAQLPLLLLIGAVIAFLFPRLADEHGLPIRGYGAMLVVAVSTATLLTARRARQMGIHPDVIFSMTFWVFLFGIIGARLFYIVEYWEHFRRKSFFETLWELANVAQGGLVVYGGVLAGAATVLVMLHREKLPKLAFLDMVAAPLAFGIAIGRLGCLMNGCCFGGPCELPWALEFPADSPPYVSQLEEGKISVAGLWLGGVFDAPPVIERIDPGSPAAASGLRVGQRLVEINAIDVAEAGEAYRVLADMAAAGEPLEVRVAGNSRTFTLAAVAVPHSLPVHPTQIYSAINGLVIGLFLWFYYPYRRRDGELTALMLTLYPLTRFLLEIIRTDEGSAFGTGLSISQNISLLVLVVAVVIWIYVLRGPVGSVLPRRGTAAAA